MIKLIRGECPEELTQDVKEELTRLYAENKHRVVWSSPKIKQPLKDALTDMTHKKCAYCECELEIEAKDVTIDHFLPKSKHADKVVEWENLFPACLRCNREKKDKEDRIINPCEENPQQFLALNKISTFRLKGIDEEGVGQSTIRTIKLNDVDRVIAARMKEWEEIEKWLLYVYKNLLDGYKERHREQVAGLMKKCTASSSYSAVKATHMLHNETYIKIKEILKTQNAWTDELEQLEMQMKEIALQFV